MKDVRSLRLGLLRLAQAADHITQELLVVGLLMERHQRLLHTLMAFEHRLDLAGLDAEAADLELLVGAAQELQRPVGPPPGQVARCGTCACLAPVRIGHKALRAQSRPVQIAPRQSRPGNVELARYTHRHRLQAAIQHIDPRVPDWRPDRRCYRRLTTAR